MRIEIDQSNKIEITNKDSILAFSNSNTHKIAYAVNKNKLRANKTITAIDIIKFLIK